ncbi:hypothetical protein H5123_11000 [Shewanella sp. SR43-4]|uniref:alpha-glutamyl/putrescinyl thymine pyrophosphorylase clade 3 protein n=1 Tax=Shewanella sp. SR43-4 TaxID=2760942 RepID=UPI0015FB33BB|nr:hypothetical protein [Shewanella sp. SR43-4]MBB1318161.1 hypothetical protein [Shewanella sp. SR43-4]
MQKKFEKIDIILDALVAFERIEGKLVGLKDESHYVTLSKQIVDSIRRIQFIEKIGERQISVLRSNPHSDMFDPLKSAWLNIRNNNVNEAYWLIFLSIHFGKHNMHGWDLCADIYGGLGKTIWTWDKVSSNLTGFSKWFENASKEMESDNVKRLFGNHRKYESLRYNSRRPLHKVIESYVNWIGISRDHDTKFLEIITLNNTKDKFEFFDKSYQSMKHVKSFGRTAKFDYLTMLKKFNLQNIEPKELYLTGATGPKFGANLLFFGVKTSGVSNFKLNLLLNTLAENLPIGILASQVLEDALCNWQKSSNKYIYFGG